MASLIDKICGLVRGKTQRVQRRNSGELASVSCSFISLLHSLVKGIRFPSQLLLEMAIIIFLEFTWTFNTLKALRASLLYNDHSSSKLLSSKMAQINAICTFYIAFHSHQIKYI